MTDERYVSHKITIGTQTFRVRIPPEEREFYDRAAAFTESTFSEICDDGVTGGPQAWAMTAFQIACDLIEAREAARPGSGVSREQIERLIRRIEDVTSNA